MGRKKRKIAVEAENEEEQPALIPNAVDTSVAESDPYEDTVIPMGNSVDVLVKKDEAKPAASSYAMTSHSAVIVEEDIYVSDGSEDEEGEEAEVVLAGSRLGIMRRGLHHPLLVQPTRNWKREESNADKDGNDGADGDEPPAEDDLSKLDPAQRAARLLQEKQRKLEEAKETARRLESEENAGRDPCLFSKRTAFDIRMDQIEDKPWTRGAGDMTDFFNYAMTEEDWLEYSKQQLAIRNELSEASRQQRAPDPTIVPVQARTPSKQTPKVAVKGMEEGDEDVDMEDGDNPSIGPSRGEENDVDENSDAGGGAALAAPQRDAPKDLAHIGTGGAWGAGAAAGSTLARLIEEQEKNSLNKATSQSAQPERQQYSDGGDSSYYGNSGKESHNYHGGGGGGGNSSGGGGDNNNNFYNAGGNESNYYGGGGNAGDEWVGGGGDRYTDGPPRRGGYSGGHHHYGGYGNFRGGDRGRGRGRGGRSSGYDPGYNSRKRGRDEYGGGRGGWRR